MNDRFRDDIIKLISEKGPLGVNAIHRETGIPLSTLQKYLHRQSYFKINEDKKWDLPENVISEIKNTTLELMTNVVENSILLLKSQLDEMQLTVTNALVPISTLKKGINNIHAPVADKEQKSIDPRLTEIANNGEKLVSVFKKQKDRIPEEYRNILFNFDYVGLVIKEGENYIAEVLQEEIYDLLLGKLETLSEEVLQILKENQV